jgi:hypothetical protein
MKSRLNASLAVAIVLSLVGLIGVSRAATASQPTISLSVAKSSIRSLYYGFQQATNQGWAAQKKYILAHNYPGMYSNATACISDYKTTWPLLAPNLNTVAKDSGWKIPSGTKLNKLANKKPAGDTYILDVKSRGTTSLNHVTILKGKAYFFLWICNARGSSTSAEVVANRAYYKSIMEIKPIEDEIVSGWGSVSGKNYTTDFVMYQKLLTLIPDTSILIDDINSLETPTNAIYTANQYWIDVWSENMDGFNNMVAALENGDRTLVSQANQAFGRARAAALKFQKAVSALKR